MKLSKATTLRLLYFFVFCSTASWYPLLVDFCKHQELIETQASLVNSIPPAMMLIIQPLYGMISDKFGYKKTMLISTFLSAISYLAYLYKQDFGWLVFITAFMSLF